MEKMRLQKYLAQAGIASRRQCEEYIRQGKIKMNGQVVKEMGIIVDPLKDQIYFENKKITLGSEKVYYILNKPKGYTTSTYDPHAAHSVLELLPNNLRIFPIGRLDKDSHGLLLLTNDGELTNQLTHPRFEHEKEYQVKSKIVSSQPISENLIREHLHKLEEGVFLLGKKTTPAKIYDIQIDFSEKTVNFKIILKEGRNRQIRRMAEIIGLEVIDLVRIRVGKIKLGDLPEGKYKQIEKRDII